MAKIPTMRMVARLTIEANVGRIDIYDVIGDGGFGGLFGGVTAGDISSQLQAMGDAVTEIHVHVNSLGGSLWDGKAMRATLADHPARVIAWVDGIAGSAATLPVMAGDEIHMASDARMVIHEPMCEGFGTSADHAKVAAELERESELMAAIYAARTGGNVAIIRAQMNEETWFTAEEAVANGFADSITPAKRMAASIDLSHFRNAPASLLAAAKLELKTMAKEKVKAEAVEAVEAVEIVEEVTEPVEEVTEPVEEVTEPVEIVEEAKPVETDANKAAVAQLQSFMAAFGDADGARYFADGKSMVDAQAAHITKLTADITKLNSQIQAGGDGEGAPLSVDPNAAGPVNVHAEMLGENLGRYAASIKIPGQKDSK